MKIMFTVQKFQFTTRFFLFLFSFIVSLLIAGCARNQQSSGSANCNQSHIDILQSIRSSSKITVYVPNYFEAPQTPFLWDGMSKEMEACSTGKNGVKIYRSSSPYFDHSHEHVVIHKMYFDNDSAFLEMEFYPTGRYVDAFLRKRNGKWLVEQHSAWVH